MSDQAAPFHIDIAESELVDLRERLRRTRWPEPETVNDWPSSFHLSVGAKPVAEIAAVAVDSLSHQKDCGDVERVRDVGFPSCSHMRTGEAGAPPLAIE